MVVALPLGGIQIDLVAGVALEGLLGDVHQLLLDEHLRPVALVKAIVLLRLFAELLVFGKVVNDVLASPDFPLHDVVLVKEHNQAGRGKEAILPHRPEELKRLLQPILGGILAQILIEFAAGDQEKHRLDALEDLDPLVALIPLAAHIVHAELLLAATHAPGYGHTEGDLRNARRYLPTVQDVLGAGYVLLVANPGKVVQETGKERRKALVTCIISMIFDL